MPEFQVLTDAEVKKMYPKTKSAMKYSAVTRNVRSALEHGMILVLVNDSSFNDMDYPKMFKLCLDHLRSNDILVPGKRLMFNCIVDTMVSDTELLAACVLQDIPDES